MWVAVSRIVTGRRVLVAVVIFAVAVIVAAVLYINQTVAGLTGAASGSDLEDCDQPPFAPMATEVGDLSDVQLGHAKTVITTGTSQNEPDQAIVIALAVAAQESYFLNYANDGTGQLEPEQRDITRSLNYPHDKVGNDHGSLGIMQQQYPWWGTIQQLMKPDAAAKKFYTALHKVPGWEQMSVTEAAQAVQRSAWAGAYAKWELLARSLLAELGDGSGGDDLCGPGDAMSCPPTGLDAEERLTPDALRVLRCVQQQFGDHSFSGVGDRPNQSDHPAGRAVDVMIDNWSSSSGNSEGWEIARWVRDQAGELGVKYVIFDAKIWSVARNEESWRTYEHPSGATDPTSQHRDHVHVSVYGNAAGGGDSTDSPWGLPIEKGSYQLTSGYGWRDDPTGRGGNFHSGLDFAADSGTPIRAAVAGKVTQADPSGNYGNLVVITSGEVETYYAHQSALDVVVGDEVRAGQPIGAVGSTGNSTGPHLHFEIRINGASTDPLSYLRQHGADPGELS